MSSFASRQSNLGTKVQLLLLLVLLAATLFGCWTKLQQWQQMAKESRQGIVLGHVLVGERLHAQIQLAANATSEATTVTLVESGMRHEPGQRLPALYLRSDNQADEPDRWTLGWLLWFAAQAAALLVLMGAVVGGSRTVIVFSISASLALCALVPWTVAVERVMDHSLLLREGMPAEATVIGFENHRSGSFGRRGGAGSTPVRTPVLHFLATAAVPPRFVQASERNNAANVELGQRIPIVYLPEQPVRVLPLPKWPLMIWIVPLFLSGAGVLLFGAALLAFSRRTPRQPRTP